jgi:signal transduction histidine kinase
MKNALSRLRWQLTFSHLAAIAFTLVAMIAAVLLIGSAWFARANNPSAEPAQEARAVALAVQGLVLRGASPVELSGVLQLLATDDLRLPAASSSYWTDAAARQRPGLDNVDYLVIVDPDGRVLGSSDELGADFAPPERAEWNPLVAAALQGTSDGARLVGRRTGSGPVALGAYPVLDPDDRPIAAVVVGVRALPASSDWWDIGHLLLFFGAAALVVLLGASVFAFASSSLVSYLLARRLVRRLEHLGSAAEAFAAGDVARRVDVRDAAASDEVGQLARRFNAMADRLAATLNELATEKSAVEAALYAKRELVANVSHELRTPLASIRGHTESLLMRDEIGGAASRSYLEVIHRQTEQLSRLIDDLFLLSTTESGALPLSPRPVVLGDVIDEVVTSIQPAARAERQVSLLSEIEPGLPPVFADRQRVMQVLANLVRNAVRHTPEGGLVAVRATRHERQLATVSVEDTGDGISPDQLEHVFERFYRAEVSRDRTSGGAGLGLAIVRELVNAMGGQVSAESVVGEGSRFSFTLPLVP